MMKKGLLFIVCSLLAVLLCAGSVLAAQGGAAGKPQENCPVMGGGINKEIYADHQGKRVYFCCEFCREPFAKDPEKYIRQLESQGVVLEKSPAK